MATFIIKEIKQKRRTDDVDRLIASADYWAKKAKEQTEIADKYAQYSREHLEEAAKLLGFKSIDALNVYVEKHGEL